MIKLYSYWRSSAAYRVRIALNLKAIDYEIEAVNLLSEPDSQEAEIYRTLNPQGLVPMLVHEGEAIMQSTAIIEYLEECFPQPALLPEGAAARAAVRGMTGAIACDIHPLNNLRVLRYLGAALHADEAAVADWYRHWIALGFDALEEILPKHRGRFCFGDAVSMADVYLVPQIANARRFQCDLEGYPNLLEIGERLEQLPAFEQAAPEQQPDRPEA